MSLPLGWAGTSQSGFSLSLMTSWPRSWLWVSQCQEPSDGGADFPGKPRCSCKGKSSRHGGLGSEEGGPSLRAFLGF